jgi:hypothetical protein
VIGNFFFFDLLFLCVCCLTDKRRMRCSELEEVIEDFFFLVFVVLLITGRCVFQRWQKLSGTSFSLIFFFFDLLFLCVCCLTDQRLMGF